VSKTDSDGNDIAGVRVPSITVPIATYTGWAQRAGINSDPDPGFATSMDDGCDGSGQYIPFPDTQAHRILTGKAVGNCEGYKFRWSARMSMDLAALHSRRECSPLIF
jgi:hypothetical protein